MRTMMIDRTSLAPVALFAYRRPEHLRRTIEALKACPEFSRSPITVYCDGPRNDSDRPMVIVARDVARSTLDGLDATMIESAENRGLAKSIMTGVSEHCDKFGRVIVVEDDLIVSPGFLTYMNAALDRYAGDETVYQVSGYAFPVNHSGSDKAKFLPVTTSWGWGTWKRA
ncbi:MAG: glycosyltransferase, partial [Acidobacteria bacterium]|nr:glycosyltransferase [Acidobacteriota bacterium]